MRVFIIGGGPSLQGFDFARLDGEVTIGINYVYRYYTPSVLIFNDKSFYQANAAAINGLHTIRVGNRKHFKNHPSVVGAPMIENGLPFNGVEGLSKGLYCTYLTGLTALSLAIALKFDKIYLLGYDAGFQIDPEQTGRRFHHQGHFYTDIKHSGDTKGGLRALVDGIKKFDEFNKIGAITHPQPLLLEGRDGADNPWGIYDCSLEGNLRQFPKVSIDEVLKDPGPSREEKENKVKEIAERLGLECIKG